MDKCRFSETLSDNYWIEGQEFDRKRCPCGHIFRLNDGKAFPDHEPEPEKKAPHKPLTKDRDRADGRPHRRRYIKDRLLEKPRQLISMRMMNRL